MLALTDLADLAVLLPLCLCVAAWLWAGGWPRGAWLWLAGMGAVLVLMLVAKLALLGCARSGAALASPSGHTAAATYVYGGMAALAWRLRLGPAAALGGAMAVLFGLSRMAVHAHSLAEIVVGGAVGLAVLLATLRVAGAVPGGLRPGRLLLCAVPLVALLHGARLNVEPRLRGIAVWMSVCG